MNKPKARGTAAETAVVRYLRTVGFPHAERRSLKGAQDQGDVTGMVGVCIEIKGGQAARDAITATRSAGQIDAWLAETEVERVNAGADVGILVVQTPGTTDPGRWWAVVRYSNLPMIRNAVGVIEVDVMDLPVRLMLADLVTLLRAAGYGDSLETAVSA